MIAQRRTTKDVLEAKTTKKSVSPKRDTPKQEQVETHNLLEPRIILVSNISAKRMTKSNQQLVESLLKLGGFVRPLIVIRKGQFEYDLADDPKRFSALLEAKKRSPHVFERINAYIVENEKQAAELWRQLEL